MVGEDDVIAQIETDKVTIDVKFTGKSGRITAVAVAEGDTVIVGQKVMEFEEGDFGTSSCAAAPAAAEEPAAAAAAPPSPPPKQQPQQPAAPSPPKPAAAPVSEGLSRVLQRMRVLGMGLVHCLLQQPLARIAPTPCARCCCARLVGPMRAATGGRCCCCRRWSLPSRPA